MPPLNANPTAPPSPSPPQRILIVDDASDVHDLVRIWLMDEPVEIRSCYDGAACLAEARTGPPDLILLDVDLPGTDGFAVCRTLKADPVTAHVPVIFLTGASASDEKLQGLDLGATDYVTKPFDPAELRARVRSALRTKQLVDLLAEKARVLQESEERFRFLAEDSSDMVSRHDAGGAFLYASPAAMPLLGVPGESLVGRSLLDLVHPADRPLVASGAAADGPDAAPGGLRETPATAVRFRHADGAYRWLELTVREARDGTTFQASARDIGRRKRMEELEQDRARVLEMVAVGRALDDVLAYVTGILERHHPAVPACVLALNEGRLRVVGPSLPGEFLAALQEHALRLATELCSGVATAGRAGATSDLRADHPWRPLRDAANRHGYRICSSRLVQSSGQGVIGMVGMFLAADREPDADLQHLLDVAAGLVAVVAEHRQLGDRLAYQARHDPLTGLPNRLLFEDRLHHAIDQVRRGEPGQVGLMLFDVDRFKLVNDTLGHQAGDELLRQFAQRVQGATRHADVLARLGGDEFALLLPGLAEPSQAAAVARAIRDAVRPTFNVAGRELVVTTSIGIALCPADASDAASLQSRADVALYRVKAEGRDGYRCFESGMDSAAVRRVQLEAALRSCVTGDPGRTFRLHYQPQFTRDGRATGVEALLRWEHPELGHVPPADFIPVAEETGLIVPLGAWALREACRQGRAWHAAGFQSLGVAVNVSPLQFAQPDFVDQALRAIAESEFAPSGLELEITESCMMRDLAGMAAKLRRLAEAGVRVAVDDFGTGHSSLAYLDGLPIQRLKIDRAFVRRLDAQAIADPARTAVVRAVASLGRTLGLRVTAEGVETETQRDFLWAIGCDDLQGYLFAPPRPPADLTPILTRCATAQSAAA